MDQQRHCCDLYQSVLCLFSSRFMVCGLTLRSSIPWVVVYTVRECSFTLLHGAVHFPQPHLLGDCLLSTVYSCLLCHRLVTLSTWGSISGLSILFHWPVLLAPGPYWFHYCSSVSTVQPEIEGARILGRCFSGRWEGGSGGRGHVCAYDWFMLMDGRNQYWFGFGGYFLFPYKF